MPFDPKTYGATPLTVRFPEANFRDVSEAARAFIRDLLVLDPAQRLSASRALAHEWLNPTLVATEPALEAGTAVDAATAAAGPSSARAPQPSPHPTTPLPTPSRLRQFRDSGKLATEWATAAREAQRWAEEAAAVAATPRPDGGKASGKRGLGGGGEGPAAAAAAAAAGGVAVADDEREEVCLELPAEVTKRLRSGSGEGSGAARSEAGPTSSSEPPL